MRTNVLVSTLTLVAAGIRVRSILRRLQKRNDLEVAVGFTATMMTQVYHGSTTIVPQVCLKDFFLVSADGALLWGFYLCCNKTN